MRLTRRRLGAPTRMITDVRVFSKDSETPICAVEVGYTRPEKLAYYKQAGICLKDLVARTGIEPVVFALKGQRVNRLHYRAKATNSVYHAVLDLRIVLKTF